MLDPDVGASEMKPRLLDLFSGAGGAAMGLYRAGFDVTGVDIKPQPHYPAFHDAEYATHFKFYQADALTFPLEGYDVYWASPPCQAYTRAGQQWRKQGKEYPELIVVTRMRLKATGKPYIIENVQGAPLINPVTLNGSFFNLKVRRTRIFECNFLIIAPLLPKEPPSHYRMGRPVKDGDIITPVGHFSNVGYAQKQMGIDWMTQSELAQAIPPAYSEYLGKYLMKAVLQ